MTLETRFGDNDPAPEIPASGADRSPTMDAWALAQTDGSVDVKFRLRRASDDSWRWHHTRSLPLRDENGLISEWLGTTTDIEALTAFQQRQEVMLRDARKHTCDLEAEIRERKIAEAELVYMASHDGLTQLWNRAYFGQLVTVALMRMRTDPASGLAVLFLDVDRFKLINDSMGHHLGDVLLMEVGRRLKTSIGSDGALARLGGDEFGILVEGDDVRVAASATAETIMRIMRRPLWLGGQEQDLSLSCSIGIVEATPDHRLPEELLRDADTAMYYAKRTDPGSYAIFSDRMRSDAVDALQLQLDLRHAIGHHEFVLFYQPICDRATAEIIGLEALLRWRHPRRGLTGPGSFVPAAEESGLIREIGRWVLREACTQMRDWQRRFPDVALFLSVNTSVEELRDRRFIADVGDTLAVTGFDPRRLQLEVTESVFLQHPDLAGEILRSLRTMGVRIALDDFGTGFSSLSYLDRYPVDTIKIDKSFTAKMPAQPSVAIVHAIVALGRAIGLDVIAEGVERADQMTILAAAGCRDVQGYLLGRPASAEAMTAEIARRASGGPAGLG